MSVFALPSLRSLEELEKSHHINWEARRVAAVNAETIDGVSDYLRWMPSMGYDALNHTASVRINFNTIASNIRDDQREEKRQHSAVLLTQLQERKELLEIKRLVREYDELAIQEQEEKEIYSIDSIQFDMSQKAWEAREISPKEYLTAKSVFKTAKRRIRKVKKEASTVAGKIEALINAVATEKENDKRRDIGTGSDR